MPDRFFIWTHSIWLQMLWEWFATAKVTSQVSLLRFWVISVLTEVTKSSQERLWERFTPTLPPAGERVYCIRIWSVSKQPFRDFFHFFPLFPFRRWSVTYALCVSSQATRWSGSTAQRWGWASNTCTLLTISRRFSNCRTNWSRAHECTEVRVTEDSEQNVTHLLQDHRTSRGGPWIVRCQMFWKYHTEMCIPETFKQTFLLWTKRSPLKEDLPNWVLKRL